MIRVRFPSGLVLQYNGATKIAYRSDCHVMELRTSTEGWIASIQDSAGAVAELVEPCSIEQPGDSSLARAAEQVAGRVRRVAPSLLAELKRQLQYFNARTWTWRDP